MEGGAMRGMFTCGVIDVFLEEGIEFDGAAGISAGATFGINFKSKQIGRGLRYNKKYSKDPRYCSLRSLIKTGDLYGVQFCYYDIPNKLDLFDYETYKNNPMEFYVGAMDIEKGEVLYHRCDDCGANDMKWIQATASLPVVSRVVEVDGHKMLDGGMIESVPYQPMLDRGYDRNVIILTQPREYRKEKTKIIPLVKLKLRKYPKVAEAMKIRHIVYNKLIDRINKDEDEGKVLVIRPQESLGIKRTEKDPDELERVYKEGRKEAYRRLEDVKKYLEVN